MDPLLQVAVDLFSVIVAGEFGTCCPLHHLKFPPKKNMGLLFCILIASILIKHQAAIAHLNMNETQ